MKTFNIKKKGNYFVAFDTEKKDVSYGKINIKTGECIGGTLCFDALREHWGKQQPKVVKESYTIWMVIEKHTEFDNNTETHEDLKEEETRSCGTFSSVEEALEQMNDIAESYQGDFTE